MAIFWTRHDAFAYDTAFVCVGAYEPSAVLITLGAALPTCAAPCGCAGATIHAHASASRASAAARVSYCPSPLATRSIMASSASVTSFVVAMPAMLAAGSDGQTSRWLTGKPARLLEPIRGPAHYVSPPIIKMGRDSAPMVQVMESWSPLG